ncbi:MAG: hypothetical protein IKL88_05545 [Erysipelotrichales bacterium]|nr:hypothetical protein [Erysipelotrichales bacterium]
MRKLLYVVLMGVLVTLSACSSSNTTQQGGVGMTQVVNPVRNVDSLEDVNAAIGCKIYPVEEYSVSDERFYVINDSVGGYAFVIDGVSYTLRAARTTEDISGVYYEGMSLGEYADENGTDSLVSVGSMWIRWFDGDMQYSLYSDDENAEDIDTLSAIKESLMK